MALTQVTSAGLKDGEIVNADLHSAAAIALSKLSTSGTAGSGNYLRGDGAWSAIDLSTKLNLTGGTLTGNVIHNDSVKALFGTGSDLAIWHQTGNSYVTSTGANLTLRAVGHLYLQDIDGNTMADFNDGGAVEIYHDGSKKFSTHTSGIQLDNTSGTSGTGTALFGNSGMPYIQGLDSGNHGSNSGIFLYSGSGDSFIKCKHDGVVELYCDNVKTFETEANGAIVRGPEGGDGILRILADEGDDNADFWRLFSSSASSELRVQNANNGSSWENNIKCFGDGAVELYFNDAKKAETVTGGFTVTGVCTATSFAGDGSNLSGVAAFPSGTKMIFQQTSAPTGWTKVTSSGDNRALRVVSGSAGSGGSAAFTSAFSSQSVSGSIANGGNNTNNGGNNTNNHTLSTSEMPSHRHIPGNRPIWDEAAGEYGTINNQGYVSYPGGRYNGSANYDLHYSNYTGSTGSHAHSISSHSHSIDAHNHSFSGSAIDLAVQYIDVIIASKD